MTSYSSPVSSVSGTKPAAAAAAAGAGGAAKEAATSSVMLAVSCSRNQQAAWCAKQHDRHSD
jgi:hypothetical protein